MNNQADLEKQILKLWQKEDVFKSSINNRKGKKEFVFYEGPPTANAKAGLHHMISRAYKDIMLRYKTMDGFLVKRRAGWDTHGLPVEVQVEKALGLKNKQEIEDIIPGDRLSSIESFNKQCKDSVWKYTQDWQEFSERMGYWLDFEDAYITYDKKYVESLWSIIKQVYDKGLLVKRHKVLPYCPRCGTSLSSHEVAQEYQDVVDKTVYVKFELVDEVGVYILAWTTTPWTLPGNVALAVGKDIKYALVEEGGVRYYLAEELVSDVLSDKAVVIKVIKGSELVGKKYHPLFKVDALAKEDKVYQVIDAPFVTTEDGTGIVHTAAMYGVDDYEEALKQGLPRIHTVGVDGKFLPMVKEFVGKSVEESTQPIIDYLTEHKLLYAETDVKHSYPFCWRCKSRLLYYAKDSWFVEMTKLQDVLIKMNEKVNWIPTHLRDGRYGEWLRDIRDWAFSRERYWGTPLPIWTYKNKETGEEKHIVVGSITELKELVNDEKLVNADFDPHRPNVDRVVLKDKQGNEYRYEEVIADVWFDSGAMPFASGEDENGRYPADYISEAVDQTRGWFYTLQAVAAIMGKKESPYKNVISLGHINDEHGKKMSKSLGNIIDPMEAGDKFGMDPIRFYMYAMNQPGLPKRFSEKDLLTSYRKNQQLLLNIVTFLNTYRPQEFVFDAKYVSENVLDQWVISLVNSLNRDVKKMLDDYQITDAARKTTEVLNDISQWYLRRSRGRKIEGDFLQTLTYVMRTFAQVMAPFTPFTADEVWQSVRGEADPVSIHLTDWPKLVDVDEDLLARMKQVREVVFAGHSLRQESKLKVRQPLNQVSLMGKLPFALEDFDALVRDELNVHKIASVQTAENDWPKMEVGEGEAKITVALDTSLTNELKLEGDLREIKRALQAARRKAGLKPGENGKIKYQSMIGADDKGVATVLESIQMTGEKVDSIEDAQQVKLNDEQLFQFVIV